ncbi:MAG: PorT family protein [Taibaiella sp.]|nr:PorT family protein [Taibaiella sp.]
MLLPNLKKKLLTTLFYLVLLCCTGSAIAQSYYIEDERTFYGGLIAGTNFTQVDGDNFAGYHKVGFNLGGIVYTKLDEHLAASMEVLYTQKGAKSKDFFTISPGMYITNYGITLNYAEVPLMLNYFDKRKSHFGAGVSYSRLGTVKEYITTSPAQNVNLNDYPFKKSDYNLLLSGNLHCWKGLFLNMRFQYSLISIRDKTPNNYGRGEQYNNVVSIRLMYLFM